MRSGSVFLGLTAVGAYACGGNNLAQVPSAGPRIVAAKVSRNPHNVLSSSVVFRAEQADSARVVYWSAEHSRDSTPFFRVTTGENKIVILGLRSSTEYRHVVELAGPMGSASSDTLSRETDDLPDLFGQVSVTTKGRGGPGLTITSVQVGGNTVVVFGFDSTGAIRWYRQFEGSEPVSGELKQQPNGNFTLYRGHSYGSQKTPGMFVEFTPAGDSVRSITVELPRYMDNHELLMTTGSDGTERLHFFTYDHRTMDLTPAGVPVTTALAGHQLIRRRADGSTEFEWNAWDHVGIEEWIEPPKPDPANPGEPDFDHPNSLGFDLDGNYIVSWRHLGQVMKIDAGSGRIIWRLGGTKSDFRFVNDPLNGFSAQHTARVQPNGNLMLFDNGTRHPTPESRAVEYALDLTGKTATMIWEFRHVPPIYTPYVGQVQRLANGNTVISFAQAGNVTEIDASRNVLWEADIKIDGKPAFCYRMTRIVSLYQYAAP